MISLVKQKKYLYFKKVQLWLSFFISILLFIGCKSQNKTVSINGNTMGTTYSIKIVTKKPQHIDINNVKIKIDSVLQVVNQQMSTYIFDSEISQFNRLTRKDWFTISTDFYNVIVMAQKISRLTEGAFDITVGPIKDLWGFGKDFEQNRWHPPTIQAINKTIKFIGYKNIVVGENSIKKVNLGIEIDLNAIAKGYGVDVVFKLLQDLGYANILVEIGGEVRCSGYNNEDKYWKIGIDKPILDIIPGTEFQAAISLNNKALATSGDYRNYFKYYGKIYSHTINPTTGYPAQNNVASASIIAQDCMTADALATALMVMGEKGIELINTMDGVEAMIIIRSDENEFNIIESFGWGKY
ncbi:MAG: FAD:protein FMN transferase [Candidatus Neomarinimicrobiota bacterium]